MAKGDRKIVVVINAPRTGVSILLREEDTSWDFYLGDVVDDRCNYAGTTVEYAVHKEASEYAAKLREVGFDYSTQKSGAVLWEKAVPRIPETKTFEQMAREDRREPGEIYEPWIH